MRAWIDHFGKAFGWSLSGLRILVTSEMAARMELAAAAAGLAWIAWLGRSWQEIGFYVILCLVTLAVEALNTAVETIVDEVSPGRSSFAGRAKDHIFKHHAADADRLFPGFRNKGPFACRKPVSLYNEGSRSFV